MKNWHKIIALLIFVFFLVACAVTGGDNSRPDLVIEYYTVTYDDCPWGGSGQVAVQVKNIGDSDAGQFATEINGDDTAVITQLAAGAESPAIITFASGPVGGVRANADVKQQVAESNEDNNSYQIIFTPPPPCSTPTP